MKGIVSICACLALLSAAVAGCGSGASEDKPIADVRSEAKTLSVDQLKAMVAKYEKAIESKKAVIEELTVRLKDIPVAQMMGEEAAQIKKELDTIGASIRALTERMNVYAAELKAKM